jgi:hypothetical protein
MTSASCTGDGEASELNRASGARPESRPGRSTRSANRDSAIPDRAAGHRCCLLRWCLVSLRELDTPHQIYHRPDGLGCVRGNSLEAARLGSVVVSPMPTPHRRRSEHEDRPRRMQRVAGDQLVARPVRAGLLHLDRDPVGGGTACVLRFELPNRMVWDPPSMK